MGGHTQSGLEVQEASPPPEHECIFMTREALRFCLLLNADSWEDGNKNGSTTTYWITGPARP